MTEKTGFIKILKFKINRISLQNDFSYDFEMMGFIKKIRVKLKVMLRSDGRSVIKKGLGSGLIWTHKVSDLRYLLGEYEPALSAWLKQKMEEGKSFIDIGANAGYFSLLAAKYKIEKSQQIFAVEPMQANIDLIKKHVNWNNYSEINIIPVAIADTERMVEFSASENLAANTYSETSTLHKNSPKISIEAKSLDNIINGLKIENFVIKIDVEGAELDVLKGGKKTLEAHKPELILATHECHVKGVEQDCLDFLHAIGYTCVPIEDEKFVVGQQDYLCRYER